MNAIIWIYIKETHNSVNDNAEQTCVLENITTLKIIISKYYQNCDSCIILCNMWQVYAQQRYNKVVRNKWVVADWTFLFIKDNIFTCLLNLR